MKFLQSATRCLISRRDYHLHRSLFYVPADDERKLAKVMTVPADTCVLELEDGVAVNRKSVARENIKSFFSSRGSQVIKPDWGKLVAVRVNGPQTEFFDDDIEACLSVGDQLKTILIPKMCTLVDVNIVLKKLQSPLNKRNTPLGVITYAESAKALVNLERVCEAVANQTDLVDFQGIVFGSDDYCADVGAIRSERGDEVIYARQKIVSVARAFGVQPIDMVYINFRNLRGLRNQSEQGARFGFAGKQCIHPIQIPIINEAFSPSPARMRWARAVIAEFEKHQARGAGAFVFQRQMIDMPLLKLAQRLVEIGRQVERLDSDQ